MDDMSTRRKELVELLRQRHGVQRAPATPSLAATRLSRDQQRLWFLEQQHPGTAQNNIAIQLDLDDPPDRAELDRLLHRLQEVHPALRLRITGPAENPVQEVADACPVALTWHDLRRDASRADHLTALAARRPLDLRKPPLYHATAMLLPDRAWRLVLVFHHMVVDGWSVGVLLEDLALLLAGKTLTEPAATFVDWVAGSAGTTSPPWVRAYWQDRFADAPAPGTLAVRQEISADSGLRGGVIPFEIDAGLTSRLRDCAQRLGVTTYAVCLAALKVLLRRLGDSPVVVVGSPTAGRNDPDLDRVVGFFVQTLALRTDIELTDNFADVARRVHQGVLEALDHQPMPFDELVELAGVSGSGSGSPLFRTMLAWQGLAGQQPEWNGRLRGMRDLDSGTAKFDLTVALTEQPASIAGLVEWAERGVDELAAAGALEAFLAILRSVVDRVLIPVAEIPLTEIEPPPVATPAGRASRASLADGLFRQARRTPGAVALIDQQGGVTTYAELADRVARTAEMLRQQGLRPGDRVALLLERSTDVVVAVHAVTAAGCGYVPIDTTAPPARIAELLDAADTAVLLCHQPTRSLAPDGPWRILDAEPGRDTSLPVRWQTTPAPAGDCAYLLFTSGSTGRPKLVAFPTDASQAFLDWLDRGMPLTADDRVLLKTPYGFDVSVWELFWPLQHGACLVLAEPGGHANPAYLTSLIRRERVTVANFVPSVLEYFLEQPEAGRCTSLRYLLSAGEALTPALRDRVHDTLTATLVNLYGPTETNAVTAYVCPRDRQERTVPIGSALPHTRLHVLDENLRPVPRGLRGELFIGGELGTAVGYWRQPALTAERFVPDPFSAGPGRRLYRTGDAARQLPSGDYEYLGRLDRQLKLHGVRIEPAEIEGALLAHPSVTAARVEVLGRRPDTELAAFCAVVEGATVTADTLRGWLAQRLPRQFMPRTVLILPRLPVTTNGKTDVGALATVWRDNRDRRSRRPAAVPLDPVRQQIRAAFEAVLGHPVTDDEQTFFDLGGSSLSLLRLAAEVETRVGLRPDIADLAAHPTIGELVETVRARSTGDDLVVPLASLPGAPRLVLLPPASGLALAYLGLSRLLAPEFDVQGVNAPGFGQHPPRTVPEFVAALTPVVAGLAAEQPVVLAGWSFGGTLAYEIGVALSAQGRPPAAVLAFDTWIPGRTDETPHDDADGVAVLSAHGLIPAGLAPSDRRALAAMVSAAAEAFTTYEPSQAPAFPVHVIRAGHGYPGIADTGYDECRGWGRVVPQARFADVAADHFGLLGPAAIEQLAGHVRSIAGRVLSPTHANTEGDPR
ncbi:hypothetical protein Aca07nite_72580 [Actinoplanes capillaceus]|uniref:Carrier domain-containing protein n=1 Tax=Actinoplanes campanulatus TaxID=113559 RepID=A0ABQ3WUZ4_9ACTN|nr:non-ribosomal peptide synthetase [Actinoplanes capillaceus]GID49983.1 hypothetical protein Aca07nite_72580 [Actinoplanes capillaceus]